MDQFHIFVPRSLGGLFQVQLAAHGNTENIDAGPFPPGDQGLEDLLLWQPQDLGCMIAA